MTDLTFAPDTFEDDPLEEVFAEVPDEFTRSRAWRLLAQDDIEELERLLRQSGILNSEGRFDDERCPDLEGRAPAEIEGRETIIADLSHIDYMNAVYVRRVGWYWTYEGSFDGVRQELGSSTIPISMEELIEMLDRTGLVKHFGEMGEEVTWDSHVYPQLDSYYEAQRTTDSSDDADESVTGISVSKHQVAAPSAAASQTAAPEIDPDADLQFIQRRLLQEVERWKQCLSEPANWGPMGGMRWVGPSKLKSAADRLERTTPAEAYHLLIALRSESSMPRELIDSLLKTIVRRT